MSRRALATTELKRLISLISYLRPYRLQVVGASFALIFTSGAVLGLGAALRYLVDAGLGAGDVALLNRAYLLFIGAIALLSIASYARYYLVAWIGERVVADMRRDVFSRLLALDMGFYGRSRTGALLSRLTTDTALLQSVIGSSVSVALRNALLIIGGMALLLSTSAALTFYVLALLPMVVAPILLLGRRVRRLSRQTQEKSGELSALAEESISGIRTVQSMTLEAAREAGFAQAQAELLSAARARIRLRARLTAIVIALVFGAVVTVLWIGGHDVVAGRITAGALSSFVFYSVVVAGAVGAIGEIIGDLQRAAGAAERIAELLALLPATQSPLQSKPLPSGPLTLALENVTFRYPSIPAESGESEAAGAAPAPATLHDVSFHVSPGEAVALVGPSGAGKTTIFQLLLRFYDPESGTVRLGGEDVRALSLTDLRNAIGLVPQEPLIFASDVWENIACGKTGWTPSAALSDTMREEVRRAAEAANALEFIEKLPQGFDTPLGERGVRLSGGQRQRLAIARALVRSPRLLLLDEATSALDAENERLVQEALSRLMQGRTTLIIAHRLSTVRSAGRIVLLDGGRVAAMGTHDALMQESPLYARLAALQLQGAEKSVSPELPSRILSNS